MDVQRSLIATLLVFGLLGFAVPVHADHKPPCSEVTEGTGLFVYGRYDAPTAEVWLEDNGYPGLQRTACRDDDGRLVGKDHRLSEICLTYPMSCEQIDPPF